MSRRTINSGGVAFEGDGGEVSPVEADPMGGNTGTATPYIEFLPPYEPPQDFPMLEPIMTDSPMYVNGQRVTCNLDGMAIGCSQAFGMLGHSADIDFANSDPWVLGQLGISWIRREIADNNAPTPPGGDPDTSYATTRYVYEYFFSGISWGSQIPPYSPPSPVEPIEPRRPRGPSPVEETGLEDDPCAGKKGHLDHSFALKHITDRHIEQTPAFAGKKSYYTFGLGFTRGSYTGSTIAKQTSVLNLNQEAYEKGGAITLSGGGIAYVYAPYVKAEAGGNSVSGFVVGADSRNEFQYTNVRTVIVKPDCKTVETSYPGLPAGINATDPRIQGDPTWWKAFNLGI